MKICDCTFPMVFSFLRKQLSGFLKSLPRVPLRFIAFGRGKRGQCEKSIPAQFSIEARPKYQANSYNKLQWYWETTDFTVLS